MIKLRIFILGLIISIATPGHAQLNEIYNPQIASLQVIAGNNWRSLPLISLNGEERINIDFDDLTHEYHRYCYKIEHCEADWTNSEEIFTSDYLEGFQEGEVISDIEESLNTNQLYTHYHLQVPNNNCRLKMSGNYKVTVYDENDESNPMFTACFMVCENSMGINMEVSTNTDAGNNSQFQQISMSLNYGNKRVTDPNNQIKTVVLQNQRWDKAKWNVIPQYIMADGLKWVHNQNYIFDGGNEYRKFETLDVNHTTMGIEHVSWDGRKYHAYTWPDEPRPSYIYDEGAKGNFIIRNSDNYEINNTCEYVMVHFTLKSEEIKDGDIYLNGIWTNQKFSPEYKLTYSPEDHLYHGQVMLKQGYYSYQYLIKHNDGKTTLVPSEGNFYQTRNAYQSLVYYKEQGGRTDKLVGYREITKK